MHSFTGLVCVREISETINPGERIILDASNMVDMPAGKLTVRGLSEEADELDEDYTETKDAAGWARDNVIEFRNSLKAIPNA